MPAPRPAPYDLADVVARLQQARVERGWTHDQLGIRAGIAGNQVAQHLAMTRSISLRNLVRLADALDLSLDWLLGRDETDIEEAS